MEAILYYYQNEGKDNMTPRIEERRTKTGHRVLYYLVMDENDNIIIITKNSNIARSILEKKLVQQIGNLWVIMI